MTPEEPSSVYETNEEEETSSTEESTVEPKDPTIDESEKIEEIPSEEKTADDLMNPVNDESKTDDENSSIIYDAKDDIENDQKQSAVLPGEDVKDEDLNKDDELKLEDDDNKIKKK